MLKVQISPFFFKVFSISCAVYNTNLTGLSTYSLQCLAIRWFQKCCRCRMDWTDSALESVFIDLCGYVIDWIMYKASFILHLNCDY